MLLYIYIHTTSGSGEINKISICTGKGQSSNKGYHHGCMRYWASINAAFLPSLCSVYGILTLEYYMVPDLLCGHLTKSLYLGICV